jgi:hypothetical protein
LVEVWTSTNGGKQTIGISDTGFCLTSLFAQASVRWRGADSAQVRHPVMDCTGPVSLGKGGEMAIGTAAMRPFIDTVRERSGMLSIDAWLIESSVPRTTAWLVTGPETIQVRALKRPIRKELNGISRRRDQPAAASRPHGKS